MGLPVKGSKASLDIHLKQVQKTLGRKTKEQEDKPECPVSFRYLWDYYLDLKGDASLTYSEIKNWTDLTLTEIAHWEVKILKTLDRIYWKQVNDRYSTSVD